MMTTRCRTASVVDQTDGTYLVTYRPQLTGLYDAHVSLLTQGGLTANYYDNVWFLNTPGMVTSSFR